jgi:hypothetical protein
MGMGITALQVVYRTSPPSKVELALSLIAPAATFCIKKLHCCNFPAWHVTSLSDALSCGIS